MRQANGIQRVSGGMLKASLVAFLAVLTATISGCGAGGYPGGGIEAISAAAVTIDAGQSYAVSVTTIAGTSGVVWQSSCSRSGCGTVTSTGANAAVYTAPSGLTAPMTVKLSAVIPNTSQAKTITITVNPDPAINGLPPAGTVGVAYSTTLTASGGTAPLTPLSMNDAALPPGLSANSSTGVISGTPTAPGIYTFTVQTTDSSAVPYTVTAQETIVISAPGSQLVFISGNPTAATVGSPYTYALQAGGGTAPYGYTLTAALCPRA